MRVRVLYHDHCFDGAASAAFFSRFLADRFYPDAEFAYTGMAHKASQLFEASLFDGQVNGIVDFKYSSNPNLTWWFDHHQSAFLTPEDAVHYRGGRSERNLFYDPGFRSCTKFIATVAEEKFGYQAADRAELVQWADIIDGAQYANAREAVELGAAAMKLTLVIEGSEGSGTVQQIIRWMRHDTLDEIVLQPEIQALYQPLYERHRKSIELIGERAQAKGSVVFFDVTADGLEGYNKFIPYYLFPQSIYTVSVSVSSFRAKVSVGSNPWAPQEPAHNLATICERYGGGGHPRVGAISFERGDLENARIAAAEIVEELKNN
ncbi:MAG: phosphoesterase [Acidobacteria bacterium]|nr:phosphoesterase [Acidobacteriota bacterium]